MASGYKLQRCAPEWRGRTAVLVGNGTSMLAHGWEDALRDAQSQNAILVVTNGGYQSFPFADVLMCSDRHWIAAHPDLSGFKGSQIVVTHPRAAEAVQQVDPRMWFIKRSFVEHGGEDIFRDPAVLVEGHTSMSTMISLAVLRGAARLILVGLDLTPGKDMRRRTYDDSVDTPAAALVRYDKQVRHFNRQAHWVLKHGVKVLNASPRSALEVYPYQNWSGIKW